MPIPRSLRRWLRLPGRAALILGLGALSTAGARADTPEQAHRTASGDILIRSEGGRIYLSEAGKEFEELRLNDTAEARHLKQLLESRSRAEGAPYIRLNSTVLASGGGAGFHWWWRPAAKPGSPPKPDDPSKAGTPPKSAGTPGKTDSTMGGKKE